MSRPTAGPYRPDFVETTGVSVLREDLHSVHLIHSRPVPRSLRRALRSFHGKEVVFHRAEPGTDATRRWADVPAEASDTPESLGRLRNLPPEDRALRDVLRIAVNAGATDCTIWPVGPVTWAVSLRVAGCLRTIGTLPDPLARRIVRRIVVRSALDPLDRERPQDGMLAVPWHPNLRFRVAILDTGPAPVAAIRILSRAVPPPPALGYPPAVTATILEALRAPHGLVLFSGPTGSGKTTGIATFMVLLSAAGRKIITLEDPVEYRIPGALQVERAGREGIDLIAAAMRQDPDVIVLGEARTHTHGRQLRHAVETGHLVVSSVHARGLAVTWTRMRHLGVDAASLARRTLVVVDQTLNPAGDGLRVRAWETPWRHQGPT